MRDPPNKKTIIGSAVHAVAEALALVKKNIQNGEEYGSITQDDIGNVAYNEVEFTIPSLILPEEAEKINASRINKSTYMGECKVLPGDVRLGRDFVNGLTERSWIYFTQLYPDYDWQKADRRDLYNFVWMLLAQVEIRKKKIIDVEKEFHLEINHPAAKLEDGSYIKINGFIDLVTEPSPGVYEIMDWKTGQRKDFESGEIKDLPKLSKDLQLCIYRMAAKSLYPNIKHFLTTIVFIRDGGAFTPEPLPDSDDYTYNVITEHIQELRDCLVPKTLSDTREDFRCKYLCQASKAKTFHDKMCDCAFIKDRIQEEGMDKVVEKYKKVEVPKD